MKKRIVKSIDSVDELFLFVSKYQTDSWWKFRGQSNFEWYLLPKAGRLPFSKYNDMDLFYSWKRRAKAMIDKEHLSDWDYLAIAQHTGLPTRLLDWTHNSLTAIFFACIENEDIDGVLWALNPYKHYYRDAEFSPFDANSVALFIPNSFNSRIGSQYSYFTIHPEPRKDLICSLHDDFSFEGIRIKASLKKEILHRLHFYGINAMTIFPDLDGLGRHLSWFAANCEYWERKDII